MTTTPQDSEPEGPDSDDGAAEAGTPEAAPWSDGQPMEEDDVMMDPEAY